MKNRDFKVGDYVIGSFFTPKNTPILVTSLPEKGLSFYNGLRTDNGRPVIFPKNAIIKVFTREEMPEYFI